MIFDIPQGAKVDSYMGGMPTTSWATWTNPKNQFSNALILAAGAGGGGGANSNEAGNGSWGAGGGAAGGFAHLYCPLALMPDYLYIQVGTGGAGGFASNGTAGSVTYISLNPTALPANLVVTCAGGQGGLYLSSAQSGGGGVSFGNTFGIYQGYTGGNGAGGSTVINVPPGSSLPTTGSPIYGGGAVGYLGGGDSSGMISVSSLYPSYTLPNGYSGNGLNGFVLLKPFTVFGGTGGARGYTSTHFNGGRGIMGSGGGGAGKSAVGNGGTGGRGGDGFVIIICY